MKKTISLLLTLCICICFFAVSPKANASTLVYGAGRVSTKSSSLNVRSSPSSTASVKTALKKDSIITLVSKNGSYWYIRYSSSGYGYCHADYITIASSDVRSVNTTSSNLRVRTQPSSTATIKTSLSKGTSVIVLSTSGDYSRILYNGNQLGYVHSDYLTKYNAISLNVHDFKQTDSRWADVTLGSSGKTIAKIGCATTALAMTESYRTNTVIYPHQMAKKLTYTSGGAVYWPQNYNIITSQTGYLTTIHNALKNGKPVIVGAKNSAGGQHYVVVKGMKASSSLSPSSFYINDPGSSTRKTLSQFLNSYPNFYKMLIAK